MFGYVESQMKADEGESQTSFSILYEFEHVFFCRFIRVTEMDRKEYLEFAYLIILLSAHYSVTSDPELWLAASNSP